MIEEHHQGEDAITILRRLERGIKETLPQEHKQDPVLATAQPPPREVATISSLTRDQRLRQQLMLRRDEVERATQNYYQTFPAFEAAGRRLFKLTRRAHDKLEEQRRIFFETLKKCIMDVSDAYDERPGHSTHVGLPRADWERFSEAVLKCEDPKKAMLKFGATNNYNTTRGFRNGFVRVLAQELDAAGVIPYFIF